MPFRMILGGRRPRLSSYSKPSGCRSGGLRRGRTTAPPSGEAACARHGCRNRENAGLCWERLCSLPPPSGRVPARAALARAQTLSDDGGGAASLREGRAGRRRRDGAWGGWAHSGAPAPAREAATWRKEGRCQEQDTGVPWQTRRGCRVPRPPSTWSAASGRPWEGPAGSRGFWKRRAAPARAAADASSVAHAAAPAAGGGVPAQLRVRASARNLCPLRATPGDKGRRSSPSCNDWAGQQSRPPAQNAACHSVGGWGAGTCGGSESGSLALPVPWKSLGVQ